MHNVSFAIHLWHSWLLMLDCWCFDDHSWISRNTWASWRSPTLCIFVSIAIAVSIHLSTRIDCFSYCRCVVQSLSHIKSIKFQLPIFIVFGICSFIIYWLSRYFTYFEFVVKLCIPIRSIIVVISRVWQWVDEQIKLFAIAITLEIAISPAGCAILQSSIAIVKIIMDGTSL